MITTRERRLVDSFVTSMKELILFFAKGKLTELEVAYLAEYLVNRLDFENEWQMHKGLGYFAMIGVQRYLEQKEKEIA